MTGRPATAEDTAFLQGLLLATRPVLQLLPLPAEQQVQIVDLQLRAQRSDYEHRFPTATDHVIEHHGEAVGRLFVAVDEQHGTVRVLDLAVLPARQGRGVATEALQRLIADHPGRTIVLSVAADNPARRLYERLGFAVVGNSATGLRMERPAR